MPSAQHAAGGMFSCGNVVGAMYETYCWWVSLRGSCRATPLQRGVRSCVCSLPRLRPFVLLSCCRGDNDRGQLGPVPDYGFTDQPVRLPGTQRFASISAGVWPLAPLQSSACQVLAGVSGAVRSGLSAPTCYLQPTLSLPSCRRGPCLWRGHPTSGILLGRWGRRAARHRRTGQGWRICGL